MSNYKRPNFDGDWWNKVSKYLQNNPEEGFEPEQVKEFIKYVVNKEMNRDEDQQIEELKKLVQDLGVD
jgi:hypothetical protein